LPRNSPGANSKASVDFEVGVIGAGFGGLTAAVELRRAEQSSFVVFERADRIGGVWRDNAYPGCDCDVRSQLYSLEARPKPDWSANYAGRREILDYLDDVVRRDDLGPHLRLRADIVELKFLEEQGCWRILDRTGLETRVRIVIVASGPFSRPRLPDIPGLAEFRGGTFHSSAWDPLADLAGKRVAVIGAGASAIQVVPNIAPIVGRLSVFQRSPAWVLPRGARKITGLEQWLFRRVPAFQRLTREAIYWIMEGSGLAILGSRSVSWLLTAAARHGINSVRNPKTRRDLTPDYKIGCKRILVSDEYYKAFNRPNVELVTAPIAAIGPHSIRTVDRMETPVDAIIFATGFVVADPDGLVRIVGRRSRVLADQWAVEGMQGYLGLHASGYPNLAFLLGPNSGPPNGSALHVVDSQMRYITQYIAAVTSTPGGAALDVKPEVQHAYNVDLQRRLASTVWNSGCSSWYFDRHGRNAAMFPGLTSQYRRLTSHLRLDDYDSIALSDGAVSSGGDRTPSPTATEPGSERPSTERSIR